MQLGSIEKCLLVIECLSEKPQGLKLREISAAVNLPESSLHHILSTLRARGYVRQDVDTKRYALGLRFLEISRRIIEGLDIRAVARDCLRHLSEVTGQTVHLAVLEGNKVVYIEKIGAQAGLMLATYIGYATEPHAAAGGKLLLSELSEDEIRRMYPSGALKTYGKRTISTLDGLFVELARVRAYGYAIDDEEYYEGVRCVAAPVRAGGRIIATVSLTGSVFALTQERIHGDLKDLVVSAAAEISARLKW
jgi:DNA-binding IclR family transcriptional regulator